jgi:hypothetical protein
MKYVLMPCPNFPAIKCYQKYWEESVQLNVDCPPEFTYCMTIKCEGRVVGAMKDCAQPRVSVAHLPILCNIAKSMTASRSAKYAMRRIFATMIGE